MAFFSEFVAATAAAHAKAAADAAKVLADQALITTDQATAAASLNTAAASDATLLAVVAAQPEGVILNGTVYTVFQGVLHENVPADGTQLVIPDPMPA